MTGVSESEEEEVELIAREGGGREGEVRVRVRGKCAGGVRRLAMCGALQETKEGRGMGREGKRGRALWR